MKFYYISILFSLFHIIYVNAIRFCAWDIFRNSTKAIHDTYNKFSKGVEIEVFVTEITDPEIDNYAEYNENDITTISANKCDITIIDPIWMVNPENFKNMYPMTKFIEEEVNNRINVDTTGTYGDFVEDMKLNGEIYGLPFVIDFGILYYNLDKAQTAPITWDELKAWAETYENENRSILGTTKYGAQFDDYREYYYSFIEATASFSNNKNFTLYGEEAKNAVDNFIDLFNRDIFDDKTWNQNSKLMKNSFCGGNIVFMRNWSSFEQNMKHWPINYGKALMPRSSTVSESSTLVRSLSLVTTKNVEEENREAIAEVIKTLTSKEFLNELISHPDFSFHPPYLDLFNSNQQFCSRVNCDFYNDVTKNLITKPLGRFIRDDFFNILRDSYNTLKEHYNKNEKGTETIMDVLSGYFEDKYIKWTDIPAIIIASIVVIGIIVTLVIFVIVVKNRTALVIRRSSPLFLYFMLIGILISFGSVLIYIGKPNEFICMIRPIILVLAFCFAFVALFLKTFRIKVIFDKSDIKVQDKYLLMYGSIILLIELVIVGLWTFMDKMQPNIKYIDSKMHYYTCSNTGKIGKYLQLALIVINAIILFYGCYLAVKVKDVYSDYNESKVIGLSIYGIMICMIVQIIISSIDSLGLTVIFIIQSLMIILSSVILLMFMFIPKFWKLQMTISSNQGSSGQKKSSQRLPNSNNQSSSYSDKNGYINMQNVENDYYNQMGQMGSGSMGQMNQIGSMGSMGSGSIGQMGHMSHMNNMGNMSQLNRMGSVGQMGQLNHTGSVGQRNNFYNNKMNGSSESLNGEKNYYNNPYNYRTQPDHYNYYDY